jgi:hypothetical protein
MGDFFMPAFIAVGKPAPTEPVFGPFTIIGEALSFSNSFLAEFRSCMTSHLTEPLPSALLDYLFEKDK